jgi:hypothetical protein
MTSIGCWTPGPGQPSGRLEPVESRHADVHQDNVGAAAAGDQSAKSAPNGPTPTRYPMTTPATTQQTVMMATARGSSRRGQPQQARVEGETALVAERLGDDQRGQQGGREVVGQPL